MKVRKEKDIIVVEDGYEIKPDDIANYCYVFYNNERVFYGSIFSCISWLYDNIGTGKSKSFGLNIEPDNDLWKINSRYYIIHCPGSFLVWDDEEEGESKYVYTCDSFEKAIDWIQGIYVSQMMQDYLDASSENSVIMSHDGSDYTMRDIITGDKFVLSVVDGRIVNRKFVLSVVDGHIVNRNGRDCVEAVLDACSDDEEVCKKIIDFCDKWYI